jgi:hypothetical protein
MQAHLLRRSHRLVLVLALGLVVSQAAAQSTGAAPQAAGSENSANAQVLFDDAIREMTEHKTDTACPKFRRSFELDPKSSTLGNLGACYEAAGKTGSAWAAYQELSAFARTKNRPEWVERAEKHIAELTPTLTRVSIKVIAPANAFRLSRDGILTTRDEWEIPLVVDPGKHVFEAIAPGYLPWKSEVTCSEAAKTYTIMIPALLKAPEAPSPTVRTSKIRVAGYIALGLGGAALVTGSVVGLLAKSAHDQAVSEAACSVDGACTNLKDNASALDNEAKARTFATVATVAFVAGAALAATGVVLVVLGKPMTVSAVLPGAGFAGLSALGSF